MTIQAKKITPSAKVVIYTFNTGTNVFPTFNEGYTYIYNDKDNGDGTTTRTIYSGDGVTLPTTMDFEGCTDLLSAEYVNGSGLTTAYQLFRGCTNLTYVSLSGFDKGNITDMHYMFYHCNNLVTIDGLENINTSNVNYMHMVFNGCEKLTSLDLTSWDTSNTTEIASLFSGCTNLTSVNLSTWNTSKITVMQSMFSDCTSLTELDLSNFNTSKVTYMSYMFGGCTNLTTLDISGWNINTDITFDLLDGCTNLTKIKLLNSNATTIDRIIERLPSRTSSSYGDLIINPVYPSEVDTATANSKYWNIVSDKKIAEYTFNSSTDTLPELIFDNQEEITLTFNPGFTSSVDAYTFGSDLGKYDIVSINIDGYDAPFYKEEFNNHDQYIIEDSINSELQHYVILLYDSGDCTFNAHEPSIVHSVVLTLRKMPYTYTDVDNGDSTITRTIFSENSLSSINFSYKTGLISVSYLDTSNVTDMRYMFVDCNNLTSLDLSSFDTSNVTNMFGMFYGCSNLTTLDLSSFDTSKVTTMEFMFNRCENLISIDLSSFDTSKVTNMFDMFSGCNNLTTLDLSNFDTSNVTVMQGMFYECNNLTSLDLSNFDTSNLTTMDYMFNNCNNLTTLNLNNWNVSKIKYYYDIFDGCTNLNLINMNNSDIETINKIIDVLPTKTEYGVINLMGNKKVSGTNYNIAKEKYWKVYYRDSDRPFIKNLSNRNTRAHSKNKNVTRH